MCWQKARRIWEQVRGVFLRLVVVDVPIVDEYSTKECRDEDWEDPQVHQAAAVDAKGRGKARVS